MLRLILTYTYLFLNLIFILIRMFYNFIILINFTYLWKFFLMKIIYVTPRFKIFTQYNKIKFLLYYILKYRFSIYNIINLIVLIILDF